MSERRVTAPRPRETLANLSTLSGERFALQQLSGGLTNRNFRVSTASGQQYVARLSDSKSALLSIDRNAEAYNSRVAASVGIGPKVVEYAPECNALLVDWIEGRTFTDADLDDPDALARVAAACRVLHAGPRFYGEFDMFDIQRGYLRIVQQHGFRIPEDYLEYEPQLRALDTALHATSDGTVACHNDLLAANIMDDGERIWFIDFEYSGNNDACFELGNIWSEADLPDDRLEHLVASYYGAPSRVHVARAHLFGLMSKYGWTLWASIQDAVSDVDFDFWHWGMDKYVRAVAEFRSPLFDDLINTVRESSEQGAMSWPTPSS